MTLAVLLCARARHRIETTRTEGGWRRWCSRCGHELPLERYDDVNRAYGAPRDIPRTA